MEGHLNKLYAGISGAVEKTSHEFLNQYIGKFGRIPCSEDVVEPLYKIIPDEYKYIYDEDGIADRLDKNMVVRNYIHSLCFILDQDLFLHGTMEPEGIYKSKVARGQELINAYKTKYNYRVKIEKETLDELDKKMRAKGITRVELDEYIKTPFYKLMEGKTETISIENYYKLQNFALNRLGIPTREFKYEIMIYGSSSGSLPVKRLDIKNNEDHSELIGIMGGDGHLSNDTNYRTTITLNHVDEPQYIDYVKDLLSRVFPNIQFNVDIRGKTYTLRTKSRMVHEALIRAGIVPGDKVLNQIGLPKDVFDNERSMISCLRGLFDTDGSISVIKRDGKITLSFGSHSENLALGFRDLCNNLGIACSHQSYATDDPNIRAHKVIIHDKDMIKKFLDVVKPRKYYETTHRAYIGANMIYLNMPSKIKDFIEQGIIARFPRDYDRTYTKSFTDYLIDRVERTLQGTLRDPAFLYGLRFEGKITTQMTDRAVLHSYHRQKVYWRTLNGKEVIQWANRELRGDIIRHIIEVINSGTVSESAILESIEKEFATMDNIELLLAFSHTNRKKYLNEYFSGIIFCIKDLINSDRLRLPQPSVSHIGSQVIFDRRVVREIFDIYRRSKI